MALLKFENVTVQYPIYNAKSMSLRNKLVQIGTGGIVSQPTAGIVTITALDNVSFELRDGDSVGLIGHNGAGKTTLLRTMAGIFMPVSGKITRDGRVATIIELGAGLDEELSGYENIYRMGMLLGSTRSEVTLMVPDIEEFTELGNFLQLPVHTYSAGMKMRLMFAVGTAVHPEILLVDETFGTGDAAFQSKAQDRMKTLVGNARIFVFASHSIDLIKQFCTRAFSLEHGRLMEVAL
ncbi:ABC transporter ATP-binding protein [Mesorhizobium sp. CU2]|uniref:ABC transporter ATP-binding protein n=1 Tax=unclassified Mesorhizobium TaxID=325217 RepID=UPI001128D274|nr:MULTISPECIES: ABC transporter ATP-binding protein [unclassified Mesorhizobium]TPN83194.1 ABC transporter ATP-binding protein [Mesorhizobium sp. CU3]TPO12206.1 ABC transporter ATP-binding protein [Mesorhizobium sp. CU2]